MAIEDRPSENSPDLLPLIEAFRGSLLACLVECAGGRSGLFSDTEDTQPWPKAAQLRQLAFALQAILAQSAESDPLVEHFLDLCTMHGENNPGEPRLARAFLNHIASEQL